MRTRVALTTVNENDYNDDDVPTKFCSYHVCHRFGKLMLVHGHPAHPTDLAALGKGNERMMEDLSGLRKVGWLSVMLAFVHIWIGHFEELFSEWWQVY